MKKQVVKFLKGFTKPEKLLWSFSVLLILTAFVIFDRSSYLTLAASLIGVTSLILAAKGNPAGQALMMVFGIIYAVISYQCTYYGEMITYAGMTGPMALFSFISWMRNPYHGDHSQVKINRLSRKELGFMLILTILVTVMFYFILAYFGTGNLLVSTVSVTTSFAAVYLTFRRCEYYAFAYALNDVVLILLWSLTVGQDVKYISVLICFVVFLINDVYGFISWRRRRQEQMENE